MSPQGFFYLHIVHGGGPGHVYSEVPALYTYYHSIPLPLDMASGLAYS